MSEKNPNQRERYALNAKGDFYVENGICLCCMIPEIEAAELMGFDHEAMHCYFKQQPLTPAELEHAIAAVAASDIQGLRYAGSDEYILSRLVDLGAADCCDILTPREKSKPKEGRDFVRVCLKKIFKGRL
jgi:hypothetical protein